MDFSNINKTSARSFHQQQALIKNVLMGKTELCPQCKKPIAINSESKLLLECPCGHISIELDSNKLS